MAKNTAPAIITTHTTVATIIRWSKDDLTNKVMNTLTYVRDGLPWGTVCLNDSEDGCVPRLVLHRTLGHTGCRHQLINMFRASLWMVETVKMDKLLALGLWLTLLCWINEFLSRFGALVIPLYVCVCTWRWERIIIMLTLCNTPTQITQAHTHPPIHPRRYPPLVERAAVVFWGGRVVSETWTPSGAPCVWALRSVEWP